MPPISDRELDRIVSHEKEWRKHVLREMEQIKKDQLNLMITVTTLKLKMGIITGSVGIVFGFVGAIIQKKLGV